MPITTNDRGWNRLENYKAGRITKFHAGMKYRGTITPCDGSRKLDFCWLILELPRVEDGQIVIDGLGNCTRPRQPCIGTRVLYRKFRETDSTVHTWTLLEEVKKLIWRKAGGK